MPILSMVMHRSHVRLCGRGDIIPQESNRLLARGGVVAYYEMAEHKPVEASPGGTRAARYLELYDTNCPTNEAEVQALAAKYDLKHGGRRVV